MLMQPLLLKIWDLHDIFFHFLFDSNVPVLGRDVKEMGSALTIGCAESFHRDVKFRDSLQKHSPFMFESAWGFGIYDLDDSHLLKQIIDMPVALSIDFQMI